MIGEQSTIAAGSGRCCRATLECCGAALECCGAAGRCCGAEIDCSIEMLGNAEELL
jgi:hypothetical protein